MKIENNNQIPNTNIIVLGICKRVENTYNNMYHTYFINMSIRLYLIRLS